MSLHEVRASMQCNRYNTSELNLCLTLPLQVVIKRRYLFAFSWAYTRSSLSLMLWVQNPSQLLCLGFYNRGRYGKDLRQSFQGFEPQFQRVDHDLDFVGHHRCVLRYCNSRRDSSDHHSTQDP